MTVRRPRWPNSSASTASTSLWSTRSTPTSRRPVGASWWRRCTAVWRSSTRSWPCSPRPTSPVDAGPTARPARAAATRRASSRTCKPGDYVVHYHHGVGRYGGMVKRADRRRRARLPAARVQGRRQALRAVRPDRRRPPLRRRRVAHAAPPGRHRLRASQEPGALTPCGRSPRSWSCCTSGGERRGHAFPPDTPWQQEMEDALPLRGDARPAARPSTT